MKPLCTLILLLLCTHLSLQAAPLKQEMNTTPLPVEQAFILNVHATQDNHLMFDWNIAPGTYLYQKAFLFSSTQAHLGTPVFPAGKVIEDPFFGKTAVYRDHVTIDVPLSSMQQHNIHVTATYQGCNDMGFCYPPQTQIISIHVPDTSIAHPEQDMALSILQNKHFGIALLSFFGFGLLLAFTPCMLPMVPILSAIIIGEQQQRHRSHAFLLALTYVLGMAFTYAGMGAIVAKLGSLAQAQLQSPLVLSFTAGILIVMACWLVYDHRFSFFSRGNHPLHRLTQALPRGEYYAVALMGIIASLIVSPCVTAPLVGALSYIALNGNIALGSAALFCLALGMGIPLIAFTWGGTALLPTRGPWMHIIKCAFSVLLFTMAITLLERFLPANDVMIAWGLLLVWVATWLKPFQQATQFMGRIKQIVATIAMLFGILIMIGGLRGGTDILRPLSAIPTQTLPTPSLAFTYIHNSTELKQALAHSKKKHQAVMLDFYADWCKTCVTLEHTVLADSTVQALLSQAMLLKVDVTDYNPELEDLQREWQVFGPPAFLFFNTQGEELNSLRIVGEVDTACFIQTLHAWQGNKLAANCSE